MFQLPKPTNELLEWIPHRPPMVWVDQVTEVTADGGSCTLKLNKDAMYMSEGVLRPSSFIEFLAQAFGFVGISRELIAAQSGEKAPTMLKRAFLVAIRDAAVMVDMTHPALADGQTLVIRMSGKKDIGPIQLTDGRVESMSGEILMTGHLKVFAEHA